MTTGRSGLGWSLAAALGVVAACETSDDPRDALEEETSGLDGVDGEGTSTAMPGGDQPSPVHLALVENSMGFIGCSMAENVAQGYRAVGGRRMWGPYGTGGLVVQSWTNTNSSAWQRFDQQTTMFGDPTAVWIQICIFASAGATYNEVKMMIANARQHAAPNATIYISGQPLYQPGFTCFLAGADGPQLTDSLAQQAAADPTQNVIYAGTFGPLGQATTTDGCHANSAGQQLLGNQAVAVFENEETGPTCSDGIQNQGETDIDCGGPCPPCTPDPDPQGCTCPSGCASVLTRSVPFTHDGVGDTCYFFSSLGNFVNNWNAETVDLNGRNITNTYVGSQNYPARVNGGYYLYFDGNFPWSHVEVR